MPTLLNPATCVPYKQFPIKPPKGKKKKTFLDLIDVSCGLTVQSEYRKLIQHLTKVTIYGTFVLLA